ncbi:MAG: DUF3786 domain-containing protein [Armatimonadota bacterium]|nr:DUF3786 domain-containing protein [Armatimonadota bacterium]MDR7519508.1 DUF3786 domain-containing protein [Armatimonadota bacterium]MDR7550201.1 DUF3786 domain-containing protein [Armatimonadota bacterium]
MSVYVRTYEGLRRRLRSQDPDRLAARAGAVRLGDDRLGLRCAGRDYVIHSSDGTVLQADGSAAEVNVAILLLLYLLEATGRAMEGRWISFEQLPGGPGYLASFRGRVVAPIQQAFGQHPERLLEAARGLDGEPMSLGDVAVRIPALPCVPIAYVLWRGDEEFSPSVSVVFDASVEGYLDAEVLTALAELVTRRLVAAAKEV